VGCPRARRRDQEVGDAWTDAGRPVPDGRPGRPAAHRSRGHGRHRGFLSPIDLIPDVFLLLGLTDDVIVVSLVFTVLRQELAGFRAWERADRTVKVTTR
jgi:hypothetical protein